MQLEKKKQFLVNTLFVLTLVFLFLFVFQYLSGVLFPILAGFIIAYSLRPLVVNITKRWNSNYQITAFMVVTAFYALYRHTALAGAGVPVWAGGFVFFRFARNLPNQHRTSYPAHKRMACLLRFLLGAPFPVLFPAANRPWPSHANPGGPNVFFFFKNRYRPSFQHSLHCVQRHFYCHFLVFYLYGF